MRDKKGISPLIATVLVIGFTIVLAALVLTWGQDLFKDMQDDAAEGATLSKCTYLLTGVSLKSADYDGTTVSLIIDNNNANNIDLVDTNLKLYYGGKGAAVVCEGAGKVPAGNAKPVKCDIVVDSGDVMPTANDGDDVTGDAEATQIGAYGYIVTSKEEDGTTNKGKCPDELGRANLVQP